MYDFLEDYPDILTSLQAMEILSVGKNKLYRMIASGQLKAFRAGREWRIRKIDLLKMQQNAIAEKIQQQRCNFNESIHHKASKSILQKYHRRLLLNV